MSYVTERYTLPLSVKQSLYEKNPQFGFNGFGEAVYYRTYSRKKHDGTQETWPDTVLRVVEGNISIAKDYCVKNRIEWHDDHWDMLAASMAEYIFDMKFLPPGRSLWALGTEYVYERGSAALQNCGFVDVKDSLAHTASWAMDMLMCGIGIGFSTDKGETLSFHPPEDMMPNTYFVPDSREGWVDSVFRLIQSYEVPRSHKIVFD